MHRYARALLSFLAGSFFSSPVISSLRAVDFGPGRSNRRIKTPRKARVVATGVVSLNTIFAATFAVIIQFWAINAFAQGTQLSAPPNQTPPAGTSFTSSTASTVVANSGGTITLTNGTVTLNAVTAAGQASALLATGGGATITASGVSGVSIANNNGGTNITFGVNATSTPGTATVTLDNGSITTDATAGGRAYGINAGVGGC